MAPRVQQYYYDDGDPDVRIVFGSDRIDDDSEEEDYAPPVKSKPAAKATAQEQPKKKKAPTAAAAKPAKKSKYIDSESESDGFQVRLH